MPQGALELSPPLVLCRGGFSKDGDTRLPDLLI